VSLLGSLPLPRRGVHRPRGTLRGLLSGALRGGDAVARFEEDAARFFGVRHATAVGSGRLAQRLILEGLQLPHGAPVYLPALTFHAVPTVVRDLGLRPVFVDVDPATLLMDPASLARAVEDGPGAVIATHLFGLVQRLEPIRAIAEPAGLAVIEDFAQAAGATSGGRRVGGLADAGYTSLETVKILPAFGGGLALTDDETLADHLRRARAQLVAADGRRLLRKVALGHVEAALGTPLGFAAAWPVFGGDDDADLIARYKKGKTKAGNHAAGLHAAQAEVGRRGLDQLTAHVTTRRALAERLRGALAGCALPQVAEGTEPAWYQVVARATDPDGLFRAARRARVDVGRGVATDLSGGACPEAARAAREVVQLPCHPALRTDDVDRVAEVARPWLQPSP